MEQPNHNNISHLELVTPEVTSLETIDAGIRLKEKEVDELKALNAVEKNFQKEAERQFKINRIQKDIENLIADRNDFIRANNKPNTDGAFNWDDPTLLGGNNRGAAGYIKQGK